MCDSVHVTIPLSIYEGMKSDLARAEETIESKADYIRHLEFQNHFLIQLAKDIKDGKYV